MTAASASQVDAGARFQPYDVVIAGAGISGLACAWSLKQSGRRVVVLEASDRAGGCIDSARRDGFIADGGPQTFMRSAYFDAFVTSLGLEGSLVSARAGTPYFYANGALVPAPTSPPAFLGSPLLSPAAKVRLLAEPLIGARSQADESEESLAQFVSRRGGRALVDALVQPMCNGIYAGDPWKLSAASTVPRLIAAERRYSSVIIGALATGRGRPKRSPPVAIAGGNDGLTRAAAAKLGADLLLKSRAKSLVLRGANVELAYDGSTSGSVVARHAVLALPAWAAAPLLDRLEPDAAEALSAIPHASVVQVALAYPATSIGRELSGFGFLAGARSGLRILGAAWNSAMFEDRSPSGSALLTAFLGGINDPDAAGLTDAEVVRVAHADLARALRIREAVPRVVAGFSRHRAIPQYDIGHARRISAVERGVGRLMQVSLTGNYFSGPSVGDCIARGLETARDVERSLRERDGASAG